ncbi:MAG: hypothetical protein IJF39_04515 [Clostridia bacterium]|nr:hypothetical protein [Clostridia bacterium]
MAVDAFYEESAVNLNEKKQSVFYTIFLVVQIVFAVLSVLWFWFGFTFVIEIPVNGRTVQECIPSWIFFGLFFLSFLAGAILFGVFKKRFNVSFDYACVYGELRISQVFNQKKRKLVCRIEPNSILQVGDMESESYDRLCATPGVKEVVCTPNLTAASGKFFLYVYAIDDGEKKLFLLECREALLINLMQYLRRDVLDREYVPQDKKM